MFRVVCLVFNNKVLNCLGRVDEGVSRMRNFQRNRL
jgi:hypothetical protein